MHVLLQPSDELRPAAMLMVQSLQTGCGKAFIDCWNLQQKGKGVKLKGCPFEKRAVDLGCLVGYKNLYVRSARDLEGPIPRQELKGT